MTTAGLATSVQDEAPVNFKSSHIESRRTNGEDVITREDKSVSCGGIGHRWAVDYGRGVSERLSENIPPKARE